MVYKKREKPEQRLFKKIKHYKIKKAIAKKKEKTLLELTSNIPNENTPLIHLLK